MNDKKAIITGGSGGIGLAIAERLLQDGFDCALIGRDAGKLRRAAELLGSDRGKVVCVPCDITKPAQVKDLVSTVAQAFGCVDVLVNCAGRSGGGVTSTITDELWLDVINTNLNATFFVTREVLASGSMKKGGSIVNIASTGGKQGVIHGAPYCASKHAMIGLTKALGLELARDGSDITVNAVCPGFVETEMAEQVRTNYARIWNVSTDEAKRRIEQRVPIGRYIEPAEVAGLVSYLVSDLARGITAQAMNVCGGLGNY
ncbi:Putative ketoacyl reductase [Paraburkholderia caffeinitolerans]|uniref:Ketoacyl reductase n=1 Tax=Paraburkholderia caffeinitolerans TaxID=1723730 RepID=A0A6J5GJQ4_9BURK|nr:SDR family NAD(P)-dependent oxidoreductase [Paraburkholderia caffeinitolerans]CAB3800769.1 Putative ketoacyl reductase [Paraburkholderia caffeinitolerans]